MSWPLDRGGRCVEVAITRGSIIVINIKSFYIKNWVAYLDLSVVKFKLHVSYGYSVLPL